MIGEPLKKEENRGLDHGAWSMLVHLFPAGNVPVLQMSIDRNRSFSQHCELAQKLIPLRLQNVLILLSGNLTHNFSHADFQNIDAQPIEWAIKFDEIIKNAIINNDIETLINIDKKSDLYKINHPTNDHFIPLLYLMGLRNKIDIATFPHMSWQHATLSMRHILLN
ncbi:MAG: class III extradiol ring-cleavage dioxygenase [Bacteroidetes bacterium]|nr:class III extradiol ring-cleavage dioxygenase [Bacteroidota bacterium]